MRAMKWRNFAAAALGAMLACPWVAAGAQDGNEYRSTQIAGWEIVQPELHADPDPYSIVRGASMERALDGYRVEYEVNGGLRRTVGVQRLNCGDATDANGGARYSLPIYVTGTNADAAAAARAAASEADESFNDACPARPAQLEAALAGLETALETVERWARERPLPDSEAWERGNGVLERTEPPVTIRFARSFGAGEEEARELTVDVEGCGEPYSFNERVSVPVPANPDGRSRARAALAGLLRQATERCSLAPEQTARLSAGFEEAVARSESEN